MSRTIRLRSDYEDAAKAKAETPDGTLLKSFIADDITKVSKEEGGGDRIRRFVISTGSVDRDNDTVHAGGWQLDNFRKNPVVLWAHDYSSLPLGKALQVGVENDKLVALAEFASHPMADTVLQLIDGGFLRATSVGFRPTKYNINEERRGLDFTEQELLEFSIVPVPANPEALIEARSAGIDVAVIKDWADTIQKTLATCDLRTGLLKAAKGEAHTVTGTNAPIADKLVETVKSLTADEQTVLAEQLTDAKSDAELVKIAKRWSERKSGAEVTISASELIDAVKSALGKLTTDEATLRTTIEDEQKAGRTLSATNEGKIRSAKDALDEVLRTLERASDDDVDDLTDPDKATKMPLCVSCSKESSFRCQYAGCMNGMCVDHASADGMCPTHASKAADIVVELSEDTEEIEIDAEMLREVAAGIAQELGAELRETVAAATASAIGRMRGRVD